MIISPIVDAVQLKLSIPVLLILVQCMQIGKSKGQMKGQDDQRWYRQSKRFSIAADMCYTKLTLHIASLRIRGSMPANH